MHGWGCLAYCLLDTHLHLLLQTPEPNLGLGMKWFQGSYAQDFNYRHARRGHVFGGRFYSQRIRCDEHLLAALVYVALNPVRAGLVRQPEDWRWSSYAATVGLASASAVVDTARALELFADEPEAARRRLRAAVEERLAQDLDERVRAGPEPMGLTPPFGVRGSRVRPVGPDRSV